MLWRAYGTRQTLGLAVQIKRLRDDPAEVAIDTGRSDPPPPRALTYSIGSYRT